MTSEEIRNRYLTFFESHGHKLVEPASLVSVSDPTLLFTVAGMQQFKTAYTHPDQAPASRVMTIQPCIRTKDIDEVGDDTHLTVFDMLGFFSFGYNGHESETGPYFKPKALAMAWEWYTKELGFDPSNMRVTYFGGDAKRAEDSTSRDFIKHFDGLTNIEASVDDNFWGPVGSSGPCGPCVEFYYNGVEVGNVVFNEYMKDTEGNYTPLDFQGVDTGLGFERIVTQLQNKTTIYETDLFADAMTFIKNESHSYDERRARIIADHTKAALYLLADGVKPGNKGHDYILRRLIRRVVRSGQLIGFTSFSELLELMVKTYGPVRPTINQNATTVIEQFDAERTKFLRTLEDGMRMFKKITKTSDAQEITGEQAFHLFETYGFPVELTQEMAEEAGWTVDLTGFEDQMVKHKEQSRAGIEKIFQGGLADHEPKTIAHHTAHHLMLAALRQVLGNHVVQRGSNVTSERLRIDVSHGQKITDDELQMVEAIVNQRIGEDLPIVNEVVDRDEALKAGALAEFGAKYPKEVSVYTIIDQNGNVFSRELCGGPHVSSTGQLGHFEILKEEASGAGLRRIRARVI